MKVERLVLGEYEANCYILYEEVSKEAVIIDPGGEGDKILSFLNKNNLKLNYILLTHGHLDHTGAIIDVINEYVVPIYITREDYEMMVSSKPIFGDINEEVISNIKFLQDKDKYALGDLNIECISTPGHSPGGMCFKLNNYIFTGDSLFKSSIGRTDFPGGDYNTLINSIKSKLFTLDKNLIVYPGHMDSTTIEAEIMNNPFLR
ncbi:MAG TPA: MBL fold metallo-hydrolase [Clostridiaceae bacterium]